MKNLNNKVKELETVVNTALELKGNDCVEITMDGLTGIAIGSTNENSVKAAVNHINKTETELTFDEFDFSEPAYKMAWFTF